MVEFVYPALPEEPDVTRMVHLLPHADRNAPVECKLFDYDLSGKDGNSHAYEALSYCWEGNNRSNLIALNGCELGVTKNLYAALQHIRDRQIPRTLWIDAICINQDDNDGEFGEKTKQIPLMGSIYAKAGRVIVWLGDGREDGEKALQWINFLASRENISTGGFMEDQLPKDFITDHAIACSKLLQRDWFRRVWVLQEVGVARHIDVMCGSTQISAHALCEGLGKLQLPQSFLTEVGPVTLLMKGALVRPKFDVAASGILPLGELLGLYRGYHATLQHDKIYALLGLSSDAGSIGLQVNYTTPWHQVLKETLQHIFVGCHIQTWKDTASVVIQAKGWILGHISHVKSGPGGFGQQSITCHYHRSSETTKKILESPWSFSLFKENHKWKSERTLFGCAELAQEGDLICQIQGRSFLSILRLCNDHFSVILPCLHPSGKEEVECLSETLPERQLHHPTGDDLTLTWVIPISGADELASISKVASKLRHITPEFQEPESDTILRLEFIARIVAEIATRTLLTTPRNKILWENVFERCGSLVPVSETLELACSALNYASNALYSLSQGSRDRDRGLDLIEILCRHRGEKLQVSEQALVAAARCADSSVIDIFIKYQGQSLPISEKVMIAAAENLHHGALKSLINFAGKSLRIPEKALIAAARNKSTWCLWFLIEHRGQSLQVSEQVIIAAAENPNNKALQLLVDHAGEGFQIEFQQALIAAAGASDTSSLERLIKYAREGFQVSEQAILAAIGNDSSKALEILINYAGESFQLPEQALMHLVQCNPSPFMEVSKLRLLLEHQGNRLEVSEEIMITAIKKLHWPLNFFTVLKKCRRDSVPITQAVLEAASEKQFSGYQVVSMLQEWQNERTAQKNLTETSENEDIPKK